MRLSRYFLTMGAGAGAVLMAVWAWVAWMPLAFLDPEYPSWLAKQQMLAQCDLGDLLILGDSRPAADILPALLPVRASNLAVGGGKPVEALAALRRALACPNPPRRVIVSFDMGHYMSGDLFWERSVRFGFLDRADLADLARASAETGDWSVHEMRRTDGLPPAIRAALYTSRFPALYVGSLRRGGVFLRWWSNQATLQAGLAARGHYYFGTAPGSDDVAMDGTLTRFAPSPVLDRYFVTLLAELDRHGIETWFVAMPVNEATATAIRPHVLADFRAYLAARLHEHPRFRLVGPVVPVWQNRWFGDGFSHLNPAGAEKFSRWLAACLRDATGTACEAPQDREVEQVLSAAAAPSGS